MGFGVSGSTAIIFLGVLIATGTLYTATSNAAENVLDAQDAESERALERTNTEITIVNATYNSTSDVLSVNVTNTGATTLEVDETTLLVDNEYTAPGSTSVDGDTTTNLWYAGQNLTMNYTTTTTPSRVKVVTSTGVAVTNETVVVS
ncbi:fla cluster protein flaF [Haloferax larsenii JCM 13917]|nr:fla cluster protein flaF [Haloferax larsenii]ELZ82835.1 fla cluster protein flaF [Haloferax larsenii JCM 13917]